MRVIGLILGAILASAACHPQPTGTGPGTTYMFELDTDQLRRVRLKNLSVEVRDRLRQEPMILLNPVEGRRIEGDHLRLVLRKIEDAPAAIERLSKLGLDGIPEPLAITQGESGNIEIRFTPATLDKFEADALPLSMEAMERRLRYAGVRAHIQEKGGTIRVHVPKGDLSPKVIPIISAAGQLSFNLVDQGANVFDYYEGVERNGRIGLADDSLGGQLRVVFVDPIVTGEDMDGASRAYDTSNRPSIAFQAQAESSASIRQGDE